MTEFSKAWKNKEGKAYLKHKDKLEVVSNGDITEELSDLCVSRFKENSKSYKKFKRVLNLKLFLKYDVPLITFMIGSAMVFKSPHDVAVVPYYNLEQTMISDGKLVKDVDDNNYIVLPDGMEVGNEYIEVEEAKNLVQYQVKNGTRNAIVNVALGEDGQMEVVDSIVGNFFDRNSDVFKDVETTTLDEKYAELVEDIGAFILDSDSLSSNTKKEIEKLLESEKTTIITTVAEYVKAGEISLEETESSWRLGVFLGELVTLMISVCVEFMCSLMLGAGDIRSLYVNDEKLEYDSSNVKWKVTPLNTLHLAQERFVKADDRRRAEIKRLVRDNLSEESQSYFN